MSNQEQVKNPKDAANEEAPDFQFLFSYTKDLSFEVPNAPQIYQQEGEASSEVKPLVKWKQVGEHVYEVQLNMTITTKIADIVAFICEIHYAGIFSFQPTSAELLEQRLKKTCPQLLFPFVRETISSLTTRSGFDGFRLTLNTEEPAAAAESFKAKK